MINSQNVESAVSNTLETINNERTFFTEFTRIHLSIYLGSGILTRSKFTTLCDHGEISEFNDIIRYVAGHPRSRAADLFVRMELPAGNSYAEFIKKHLLDCRGSVTSYLGSWFMNTSRLLSRVAKEEITTYPEIVDFSQKNPGSRTAKLMK